MASSMLRPPTQAVLASRSRSSTRIPERAYPVARPRYCSHRRRSPRPARSSRPTATPTASTTASASPTSTPSPACAEVSAALATTYFVGAARRQATILQHGFDAGLRPAPRHVHLLQVFGVATRQHHVAEAIAVGARQAAVVFEPLVRIVVEHLGPQVGVVAGGISAAPDVAEVARTVARRHVADREVRLFQRLGFELIRLL